MSAEPTKTKPKRKLGKRVGKYVRYTAEELDQLEDKTDWARVDKLTDAEIHAAIESDPDAEHITDEFWERAVLVRVKKPVSIRLDSDIIAFFKAQGRGYQTRINQVLRAYKEAREKRAR